jgi:16S rRNA G966 N2-methylase RsmD
MKYQVVRNPQYDYTGQSYASLYPNLHRYPATMLPQIGIDILKELNLSSGALLDPYCGSGSSFASGLERGITEMYGFDINPLAVLISRAKFTKISLNEWAETRQTFSNKIVEFLKNESNPPALPHPTITNINFWFSDEVIADLTLIKYFIDQIANPAIRTLFLIPFSETVRACSYTRNNEFKLFKMKPSDLSNFKPDTKNIYLKKLDDTFHLYTTYYYPKLSDEVKITVEYAQFQPQSEHFDVVLTSPPYGDSRTTVAYGQFSTLSNEWMNIRHARRIDSLLMGGTKPTSPTTNGLIAEPIAQINLADPKRALEVSAFYNDLSASIQQVAACVRKGGKAIYIVGNRTVRNVQLPTDQFIAEKFEANGFKHLLTYQRALSNKVMPARNSPTNVAGKTVPTMLSEYIVVCEKTGG